MHPKSETRALRSMALFIGALGLAGAMIGCSKATSMQGISTPAAAAPAQKPAVEETATSAAAAPAPPNKNTAPEPGVDVNAKPIFTQGSSADVAPKVLRGPVVAGASEVQSLTLALRAFAKKNGGQMPSALDELVAGGFVRSIPPAPAGKKFTIDPDAKQVKLVSE
jgi:hypothetical protein